eukprot:5169593-Amphidinium_carterae.1
MEWLFLLLQAVLACVWGNTKTLKGHFGKERGGSKELMFVVFTTRAPTADETKPTVRALDNFGERVESALTAQLEGVCLDACLQVPRTRSTV